MISLLLRMFGILLDSPANVFSDNETGYCNATFVESKLKQKQNSICFHLVREAVAVGKMLVFKVDGNDNLADLLPSWYLVIGGNILDRRSYSL